ncbi:HD domain-containing protein [Candidatus Woesearchaeota archaeon]|nr:HD domain-containing protein [Candidatus Woesearchaeota archaeon]
MATVLLSLDAAINREYGFLAQRERTGWLRVVCPRLPTEEDTSYRVRVGAAVKSNRVENVAQHSIEMAVWGYVLAKLCRPDLDAYHVFELSIIHDLEEGRTGDYMPGQISVQEKFKIGSQAIQDAFRGVRNGEYCVDLWLEYAHRSSAEAHFVKELDNLQMALAASRYKCQGYVGLDEFYKSAATKIKTPELVALFEKWTGVSKD